MKGLCQIALKFSGAEHDAPVRLGQFFDAEHRDDIFKLPIACEVLAYGFGDR